MKKPLIIISIILIIGLVGLGGYLIYDKSFNKDVKEGTKETQVSKDIKILKNKLYQLDTPHLAAGFGEMLYLGDNMEFYAFANETDIEMEKRLIKGTWEIKDGELIFTATKLLSYINGTYNEETGHLTDYDIEITTINEIIRSEYKIYTEKVNGIDYGENNVLTFNGDSWYTGTYKFDELSNKWKDNISYINGKDQVIKHQ